MSQNRQGIDLQKIADSGAFEIETEIVSFAKAVDSGCDPHAIRQWARQCADQVSIELMSRGHSMSTIVQGAIIVYEHCLLRVRLTPLGLLYPGVAELLHVYDQWLESEHNRALLQQQKDEEEAPENG